MKREKVRDGQGRSQRVDRRLRFSIQTIRKLSLAEMSLVRGAGTGQPMSSSCEDHCCETG
jgi:hypothetical protein